MCRYNLIFPGRESRRMNIDTHAIEFPMKTFNLENKTNIVTETRVLNNLINVKTDQINKFSDMYTL